MTRAKKNLFVTVLAVMLVAVLTMTALVACGEETPETVKVTFKDGETVVASVDVAKGTAVELTSVPAAPVKDGYTFVGWYVGETKFDGTITFDADTVFTAKYARDTVSVTFKDGDADYKKVTVGKGEKIAEAELPSDPTAETGYRFDGWFNGEVEFDEETAFSADATYTAKYTKVAYVVKFVDGEAETVKLIDIVDDAKLAEDDVPAASGKEGFVFMGWYNGLNKAAADVAVTADVTYEAIYNDEATYAGYWINTAEGKEDMAYFDKDNAKVTYSSKSISKKAYTYDATTGTVTYAEGSYSAKKTYTFTAIGANLTITLKAYDDVEEVFVTTEIAVLSRRADAGLGGVYAKAQKTNVLTVEDNGIISMIGGNPIPYGVVYTTVENGVTVYHFDMRIYSTGTLKKLTATVDEKGNYIMTAANDADASYAGIYAKDAEVTDFYYSGDYSYFVSFKKGEVIDYTYIVKETVDGKTVTNTYYATVSGEIALDKAITISYGEGKQAVYMITKMPASTTEGNMTPASSERGTYTGSEGSLYLDGFETATVTPTEGEAKTYNYFINKVGTVILADSTGNMDGASIDTENKTYEMLTSDGKAGMYVLSGSSYYSLIIDGFGGATVAVKYSWSTTPTYYYGTYAYAADGASVTLNITDYSTYNKTYSVEEEGNALVSADGNIVFLVSGYTAEDKSEQFVGYFVDADGNAIEITSESSGMWIRFNGVDKQLSKNWNGTKLTFSAYDFDAAEGYTSYSRTYTVTMVDGKVVIAHDCIKSYDDICEELETEAKSFTYTKTTKPFAFAESARGTWYLSDNTVVVITESTITVGGVEGTDYNQQESGWLGTTWNFKINDTEYTIYEDGTTAGKWYYGLADSYDAEELSATEHTATTTDGLEGTYVNGSNTITLDGKGNGVYNNGTEYTFTYSGTGSTKTVSNFADFDSGSNTITVTDTGLDVHFADSYGDTVYNASFTKEVPATIGEDMQGTFTGDNGYTTTYTVKVNADSIEYSEVDETWSVNIKATITEYTIKDDGYTIAWSYNNVNYKFSSPSSGLFKLYIGSSDDYTLTKEALDAFAGTWAYSYGTFTFDGKGTVTVTGSNAGTYTYTVSSDGKTATYYNSAYYETITCELSNDGTTLTVNDEYGDWLNGVAFTKQA